MLLNHSFPYPDEALSSWVWRLAHLNYVPSPTVFLSHLHVIPASLRWNELRESKMSRALAALTNTSVATIHAHTLHRFAALLTAPQAQTLPLPERLNHDFYTPTFAWCPACLAEAYYVRLHWHVPFMVCCTVHECWMLDACPNCQMRLREPDILAGRCAGCGIALERAAAMPVPSGDPLLRLQNALLGWLYEPKSPTQGFPAVPVAVLVRILRGLRYSVQRAGNGWNFHYVPSGISSPALDILKQRWLTLFERGCLYTTAVRGLLDWPHGFYAFLDAYRARPAAKEKTGLRREFGTLYSSWLNQFWKHPAFSFVQHAFNDYLVEHIPVHQIANSTRIRAYPDLLDRVHYLDLKQTAKYLGSSVKSVYRLVEEGQLTAHRFPTDVLGVWFARHELERCKQTWEQHIPFAVVARQLGLSKRLTGELLHAQLLRRVPTQVGLKQLGIFVERDGLQTLLSSLKSLTTIQPVSERGICLLLVCIRNGSVRMDMTHVLTRVLAGKLPAYHPNESLLPLSALWFMPQDVEALATHVKAESDWFTKEEVRVYLGVGWRVVHSLLVRGLLHPVVILGRKQFFSRQEVRSLHENCIFTVEMQKTLGIPFVSIHRLVEMGMWFPKAKHLKGEPYVFDRTQFQQWRQQYIMLPELKLRVLDTQQMLETLRRSDVVPVVRAPLVYARKEVMTALNHIES